MKQLLRTLYEAAPVAYTRLARGVPDYILRFDGGIGDEFLCSAVAHELKKRGARNLWMLTDHPELFRNNPDIRAAFRKNRRGVRRALEVFKLPNRALAYAQHIGGRDIPPNQHVVTALCQSLGITGLISKRPYLHLTATEKQGGCVGSSQIAVQSSGLSAKYAAVTKEWFPARFQQVVDFYRSNHTIVQVGSAKDPLLDGVVDMRGKTTIRGSASILANSIVFIGLAGFLQHLARSVECRSVIIYGGRELPSQTGYTCNENVTNSPACSPCWIYGMCEHQVKCMDAISVDDVLHATNRQIARRGEPLAVDTEECAPSSLPVSNVRAVV